MTMLSTNEDAIFAELVEGLAHEARKRRLNSFALTYRRPVLVAIIAISLAGTLGAAPSPFLLVACLFSFAAAVAALVVDVHVNELDGQSEYQRWAKRSR